MWTVVDLGRAMGHYRWGLMSPDGEVASYHCHLGAALGHACLRNGFVPARPVLPNHRDCRCPRAVPQTRAEVRAHDLRPKRGGG